MSDFLVEGDKERYQLTWPGKKEAILNANTSIDKTLRPIKEDSVEWENTQNLYIEGDNLEVLKLLQESYLNKIQCIYIDPPYNTGKDFIYKDNFRIPVDEYYEGSGQIDEEGHQLVLNPESNGRFHSDWLTMMYSRIKVARNLLSENGVFFLSIDDNEAENLKKICNEIFGEHNFIATFVWNTEGHTDNQYDVKVNHEYVYLYSKNNSFSELGYVIDPNTRAESNLWKGFAENSITKNGPVNPPSEVTLPVGFPCKIERGIIEANIPDIGFFNDVSNQGYISRTITEKYNVSYPIRFNEMVIDNFALAQEVKVFSGWANVNKLRAFIQNKCKPLIESDGSEISFYLSEKGVIYYFKKRDKARNILSVLRNLGTTEQMRSELEDIGLYFSYPKPKQLLQYLLKIGAIDTQGIILDFFSGSSSTAHAVMQQNAEDGGKRRYIMIQLPEPTEEKSEAFKAGFKNICEIGKERIRRAAKKIKEETGADIDYGFRVFRVDSSNMKDVYYTPDKLGQMNLDEFASNIKEDRTGEDLLIQVMLECGLELSLPIESREIEGKTVHYVAKNSLIACFNEEVSESIIKKIAADQPRRVVFRDSSFPDDSARINVEELFKLLSPSTEVQVL
ncbi:site-specific DNA-methyltransferase [Brevibacillus borstelensis]|uniref:site-specific DNA-methyltransferase n=1 Tax=Brevibacillus borstelensis TaxID=45462 RepID=UPI003CC90996